ncbi:MAG: hypothetical protein KAG61_06135 [Bacteriovoracaceae bacterium]|nr:hypothetical protein [Bacteriovoracaceae bacterium]
MSDEQLWGERTLDTFTKAEYDDEIFSPGIVYWIKGEDKSVKVVDAGDPFDHEQLQKFFKQGATLKIDRYMNIDVVSEGKIYLNGLKNAKTEVQRLRHRKNLIKWFSIIYWDGARSGNLVDLMKLGTDVFYSFDPYLTERFVATSTPMFKRSGVSSTISVFLAIILGYTDFKMLRDLYHLSYLFDFSFDGKLSYNAIRASELERECSGEGVAYLFLGDNPGPELDAFIEHPRVSYERAYESFQALFNDPGILRLIKMQHEKVNGKGFPASVKACDLSDIESLVIFINHMIPYEDFEITPIDGMRFLKASLAEYEYSDINEVLSARFKNLIVNEINRATSLLVGDVGNGG